MEIRKFSENDGGNICKNLIAFLKQCKSVYGDGFKQFGLEIDDAIAWLENQGEQNLSNVQSIGKIWKEPVSEDLEEASKEWLIPQLDKSYANYGEKKMMELTHFDGYAMLDAIEFGVKWKEHQFEKNRLKHCNSITNEQAELEQVFIDQHLDKHQRMPTFLDAIEYGMRLREQQMMARAVDGEVGYWNLRGLSVNVELPRSVNEGDMVKVIVIKEEL